MLCSICISTKPFYNSFSILTKNKKTIDKVLIELILDKKKVSKEFYTNNNNSINKKSNHYAKIPIRGSSSTTYILSELLI